jgi:acetate kinase
MKNLTKSIAVLNAGSTSLKYKVFSLDLKILASGEFANLNPKNIISHKKAFRKIIKKINKFDIVAIGHRVVHGGDEFKKPALLNNSIIEKISKYNKLAPLHNPFNLAVIKEAKKFFSAIPQIAVFDTSFFADIPLEAKIYGLPPDYFKKMKIQRFGFHGISHQYVTDKAAEKLNKRLTKTNLITCHLGGGTSICAIKKGKPIEISMGFTPLEGPLMMRRSGNLDPGIILYLLENGYSSKYLFNLLNFESGFYGFLKTDNFLKILDKVKKGNKKANLVFNVYVNQIKKYIGAYFGLLGFLDAIVFTGAIGAGKPYTRKKICQDLKFLEDVPILAIPSDEEFLIAKEARKYLVNT